MLNFVQNLSQIYQKIKEMFSKKDEEKHNNNPWTNVEERTLCAVAHLMILKYREESDNNDKLLLKGEAPWVGYEQIFGFRSSQAIASKFSRILKKLDDMEGILSEIKSN